MTFVDTSAWLAIFVRNDANRPAAREWLKENGGQTLITTDFVIDELLTLLRCRNESERALRAGEQLVTDTMASIEFVTTADFEEARRVFRHFNDKTWSFTDGTSRAAMTRLGIETALAFDSHFRQFGTVSVVP